MHAEPRAGRRWGSSARRGPRSRAARVDADASTSSGTAIRTARRAAEATAAEEEATAAEEEAAEEEEEAAAEEEEELLLGYI